MARLTMGEAVIGAVTTKYATFSGRARPSEYWYFALFTTIFLVVLAAVEVIIGGNGAVSLLLWLALLLPGLAVTVRRLHDTGRSGWWILLWFVPAGWLVLLVFHCFDSQPGDNVYGPNPKDEEALPVSALVEVDALRAARSLPDPTARLAELQRLRPEIADLVRRHPRAPQAASALHELDTEIERVEVAIAVTRRKSADGPTPIR
jgi:uncharacterized membrane protein YhaH (DUF805 family)